MNKFQPNDILFYREDREVTYVGMMGLYCIILHEKSCCVIERQHCEKYNLNEKYIGQKYWCVDPCSLKFVRHGMKEKCKLCKQSGKSSAE